MSSAVHGAKGLSSTELLGILADMPHNAIVQMIRIH